jgi:hypothetical protein
MIGTAYLRNILVDFPKIGSLNLEPGLQMWPTSTKLDLASRRVHEPGTFQKMIKQAHRYAQAQSEFLEFLQQARAEWGNKQYHGIANMVLSKILGTMPNRITGTQPHTS